MAQVEELLNPQELIDYTKERKYEGKMGEILFPARKTEALEIKMLKGASNLPVSAKIHSFDVEAEIGSREGTDVSFQDLALIKKKFRLSEKELIALESPRNDREEAEKIDDIYRDIDKLVEGINVRVECLRMEALSTGKIMLNENGVKGTIDYGMPATHKETFTWREGTPDILEDIYKMRRRVKDDTGFTTTRILTSEENLSIMLRDEGIRSAMFGVNSAKMMTVAELNAFLAQQRLPKIAVYDEMYSMRNSKGTLSSKRYLPENSFILMPDGKLGDSFFGLTAEELELRKNSDVDTSDVGNIIVCQYNTTDPVARWVKAVATSMVSFPYADQVFSATIK